jgi:hypothetical protein
MAQETRLPKHGSACDGGNAAEVALDLILAGMDVDEALVEAGLPARPYFRLPVRAPADNPAKIRNYVTRLLKALVPWDFYGLPLYIGMQSELPPTFHATKHCLGFVSPSLDEMFKPHLGTRYTGRGPAVFLADLVVEERLVRERVFGRRATVRFFDTLVTTAIHEVAHILEWRRPFCGGYSPDGISDLTQAVMEFLDSDEERQRVARVPHAGHEWAFIRNCVHLNFRAACGGVRVRSDELAGGDHYGLSSFTDYRRALGNEPERMIDASFQEIREEPPPEPFIDLWDADMLAFQQRSRDFKPG